jgi:hypothetical protein
MKAGIVGYRNFNDKKYFEEVLKEIQNKVKIDTIISGCAEGADTLARNYSLKNNICLIEYPAEWLKYGKAAGPIRNKKILNDCDILIAFLSKNSKGTKQIIQEAERRSIRVIVIEID